MVKNSRERFYNLFLIAGALLCLSYCLLFRPVTTEAQGDYPAYLDLARQIYHLPGASETDQSHRSPLYSLILGGSFIVFGEGGFLTAMMVLQYTLIFFSSWLVYKIISRITGNQLTAFIAGIAGVLNLTVIFFGFMMLSETIALVLFTLLAWLILRYSQRSRALTAFLAGIVAGLLILARFNMLGLPFVIAFLIVISDILNYNRVRLMQAIRNLLLLAFGTLLITGSWSAHNYFSYGRFELLPKHHAGQRWAIPSVIDHSVRVSEEYQQVLDIFLQTRDELMAQESVNEQRKASLLGQRCISRINDYFRPEVSGYLLYKNSEEDLLRLYGLPGTPDGIRELNEKLKPFYREIAEANRSEIMRLRIYSFLYSFKYVSPTLSETIKINLNLLPAWMIRAYKAAMILIVTLTYAGSLIHLFFMVRRRGGLRQGVPWLILYALIWYFPLVNTWFNVLSDANRFRFPADMLIIALFVTFLFAIWQGSGNLSERDEKVPNAEG